MTKPIKDLDRRARKIFEDVDQWGHALRQDYLRQLKEEIENDYHQVEQHCSYEYTQLVQRILLLLDKHIRKP
jgi:vacuolar-type H+-ATPase subunit H